MEQDNLNKNINNLLVTMIGGGNYTEYQNLQDYQLKKSNIANISYITTDIVNSKEFLTQLQQV